ncbi:rRNA methyltransferase [Zhengella mangrovi]|uniref:rRNA methyltransferase n=1 Tax=Zhengella mangrovi TaxID=1982044 RepID=A0A2G1QTY5_9HYPH|nr:RNA methyltransferase [Zhengella mangrovi]PHP69026.1 rRNA methyltransferase [Zhengella mangrovi]
MAEQAQRGYYGIGVEGIAKPMNLGSLMRTAHAFGASFVFTLGAGPRIKALERADTSRSTHHVPYYTWDTVEDMALPSGCVLVGVELTDDAIDLPTFRHPLRAAYLMGRERGSLSPEAQARCAHVIRIPTRFCINVGLAGALIMYDRMLAMRAWPGRNTRSRVAPKLPGQALTGLVDRLPLDTGG